MLLGVRQIAVGFVCPCYTEPTFLSEKMRLRIKMEQLCVGTNILQHCVLRWRINVSVCMEKK